MTKAKTKTFKTTVYLLSRGKDDTVGLIVDALAEYLVNHPERMLFAKATVAQLEYCKQAFTEEYELK